MHKSKLYDMAGEIAMDKLMPKPVEITISMRGGGGLSDLREQRYNVKEMSDKKLADELAWEDVLRSSISDEDLRKSGLIRVRTRPWAIFQGEEYDKRKGAEQDPKTAHIRKLYYLSLKRLLDEVKQKADRKGESFPYEKMQRIIDRGMTETFPEGYVEPIASEYDGKYGMHLEPGDTQDFKDAYSGGGYPGPSFIPNLSGEHGQTAPVFESSYFEEIEDQAQSKKGGGGISDLNDSININGQPHRLVWANPQEERVLKKMGGSGKKVLGKPAYFDEWSFAETAEDLHGPSPETQFSSPQAVADRTFEDDFIDHGTDITERNVYDYLVENRRPDVPAATYMQKPIAAARTYSSPTATVDFGRTGPFFLGSDATEDDAKSLWMTQYIQSNRPRHDSVSQEPIDIEEEYQKARNAPGGLQAIARGYQIGDPLGEQMRNSFNLVNQQLQNKFTEREMQKLEFTQDEITKEELQDVAKDFVTDFTPYDGTPPSWMPSWMQAIVGFASRTVIGTGKVGGVGVHIHEDGTVTAISPEDSPGYDHELHHEPGGEVARRYRPRPVEQASISETIEEEPTGIAKVLASRSKPSTLAQLNEEMKERVNRFYNRNIFT